LLVYEVVPVSAESAVRPEREGDRADLPAHLTRDGGRDEVSSHQFLQAPNEAYCLECGRRITIGSSGGREYGHRRHGDGERGTGRCEHRSDECDPFDNINAATPSEQAMLDLID
jgi:hypothetical protein